MEWNLDYFFKSEIEFTEEIEKVKKLLEELLKMNKSISSSLELEKILTLRWHIKELSNNILIYGSLSYYKNVHSEECIKLKKQAEEFNNEVDTTLKKIDTNILNLGWDNIDSFIHENDNLKPYYFWLSNLFRLRTHQKDEEINQKIKIEKDNINQKLSVYNTKLRDIKYGNIKIDDEDVCITSANFSKYISARDRQTRKDAYFAVNNAFDSEKDEFAQILNDSYHSRNNIALLDDYKSVLEKVLFEENIDSQIIFNLIEVVNKHLKLSQEYLHIKADLLGIEDPHLYDFGVSLNNNLHIKYTIEEAKQIVLDALAPLGEKYLKVVKTLFDGHIDTVLDENKHQSITFSWHTFSFMNFKGAYVDLKNLIHEIGHIVNYYLSKEKVPFMYEDSTIFVGETASLVNEILLNKYLYEHASKEEEKIFYLSKEIENYYTTIYKQVMYTEFENKLYELSKHGDLTSDILNRNYEEIIKKYYGEKIYYDEVSYVEWTRLGHLYRWSYYPYKYATGLIMASATVDSLLHTKTLSTEEYLQFLSLGSSMYSLDLLKSIHIDLKDSHILESGLNVMEEDIGKLKLILEKQKTKDN